MRRTRQLRKLYSTRSSRSQFDAIIMFKELYLERKRETGTMGVSRSVSGANDQEL